VNGREVDNFMFGKTKTRVKLDAQGNYVTDASGMAITESVPDLANPPAIPGADRIAGKPGSLSVQVLDKARTELARRILGAVRDPQQAQAQADAALIDWMIRNQERPEYKDAVEEWSKKNPTAWKAYTSMRPADSETHPLQQPQAPVPGPGLTAADNFGLGPNPTAEQVYALRGGSVQPPPLTGRNIGPGGEKVPALGTTGFPAATPAVNKTRGGTPAGPSVVDQPQTVDATPPTAPPAGTQVGAPLQGISSGPGRLAGVSLPTPPVPGAPVTPEVLATYKKFVGNDKDAVKKALLRDRWSF
jgi:hypothetical protein